MKRSALFIVFAMGLSSVVVISTPAMAKTKIAGKIGSVVADGDLSVQVKSLSCGLKTIGTGFFQETAVGQFCVVSFIMKAAKKKPISYFASNQKGITKAGYEVEPKSILDDVYKSSVDLNPGMAMVIKIAFDVGKTDPLKIIEFHDSMFSGGVQVALTGTAKK
jgi:hypothetical protein